MGSDDFLELIRQPSPIDRAALSINREQIL